MTVSEQIKALSAKRESNRARMTTLAEKAAEEGRTMDDAEGEEYDDLAAEIKTIEKDLSRLSQLQDVARSKAEPVAGETRSEGSARGRACVCPCRTKRPSRVLTLRGLPECAPWQGLMTDMTTLVTLPSLSTVKTARFTAILSSAPMCRLQALVMMTGPVFLSVKRLKI